MSQFVQITPTALAAGLGSIPANHKRAVIEVEGSGALVRYRTDGVAPTASAGHVLNEGDVLDYDGDLTTIQFIRVSGSTLLNVTYEYE